MASEHVLSAGHICRYAIKIIKNNVGNRRWCCPVTERRVSFSNTAEEVRPQNCNWRREKAHFPKGLCSVLNSK